MKPVLSPSLAEFSFRLPVGPESEKLGENDSNIILSNTPLGPKSTT